jgi:Mce-associated membrane protein
VSSRERFGGPPDSDRGDDATLAAANEEVCRAEARAGAARARAAQLSRQVAEAAAATENSGGQVDTIISADRNGSAEAAFPGGDGVRSRSPITRFRLRRVALPRPGPTSIAVGAAIVLICASLAVSGYVVCFHRTTVDEQQRGMQFAAAARRGAVTLMSIDAGKAREDLQRIIDNATGQFKNEMLLTANDRVEQVEQSKLSTKATVTAVAVESMTADSAVVLVTTKSEAVDADNAKSPPRYWRLVMTLQQDGGQLKIAKIEFVR